MCICGCNWGVQAASRHRWTGTEPLDAAHRAVLNPSDISRYLLEALVCWVASNNVKPI